MVAAQALRTGKLLKARLRRVRVKESGSWTVSQKQIEPRFFVKLNHLWELLLYTSGSVSAFEQRLDALQKKGGLCHLREICSVWPSCNFEKSQVAHAQQRLLLTAKISKDLVLTEHAPASCSSQCCPNCFCIVSPEQWSMLQPLSSDVWQDCAWATPCSGWACFSPQLQVLRRTFPLTAVPSCSGSQHWGQGGSFLWSQR